MSEWDVETKQGGDHKNYEIPPDGAIPARICALVDLGYHDARSMTGEVYQRRLLAIGFELAELDSAGQPFFMTRPYTLSLDLKSALFAVVKHLHGDLKIGDKFDPDFLANKPCLLQISHKTKLKKQTERTYANIGSVGRPPRGTVTPPGECVVWRISELPTRPLPDVSHLPPVWNENVGKMLTLPEWVRLAAVTKTPPAPKPVAAGSPDDDIPF